MDIESLASSDNTSGKRLMGSALFILVAVYGVIILAGIFISESMMFQPRPSSYADHPNIIKIPSKDGSYISAYMLENQSAHYTVLFSHGNAEDIGDLSEFMKEFTQHGFNVIAYDYSGYGSSNGKPSERAVLANADAVYDYLVTKRGIAPERIIVWGRSIGSGPSVHLAVTHKVGGLVIESGFTSAFRVMTRIRIVPFDRFDNLQKIVNITCPVLVIHGKEDEIIPFRHGQLLFEAARQPKMNFWVNRAGHNDLGIVAGNAYWDTALRFKELIERN